MAMNGNVMASEIIAALATLSDEDKKNSQKAFEKMCTAIVAHIQVNAQISTTVNTVVVGTLPAGPVAATGSGAGTGTIS